MADEPELKTTTRQRVLNPLLMAWGLVVILLSLTVAWVYLSEDPAENIELVPEPQIVATQEESGSTVVMDLPEQQEEQEVPINAPAEIDEPPVQSTPQISSTSIPETQVNQSDLSLAETQTPLSQVPNDNLVMQGDNGLLPVMGPDGLIAWKEYARPFQETDTAPRISILITDVGLNTKSSTAAIDTLPGQIDLGFSAYGRNLQNWMDKSRAKGHEAFLMIPTEPINYPDNDPGPHTLIAEATERDNLLRLNWLLSQVTGYVGVVNHMGSKFTASEEALTPVLTDLQSRGLMLIDSRSTRFSMAARTARRLNMPRAINDRYIDNVITSEEIQRQLAELENTATTFGAALGLARATPLTINEIARWSMSLSEKGIELVPITAIANRQPIK